MYLIHQVIRIPLFLFLIGIMSSKFLHIVIPRLKNIVLPATSFPSIPKQEMRFTVFKHLNATPAFNDDSQENSIL